MSNLQRKIKQLEINMNAEKLSFRHNGLLLKQCIATPTFLVSTMVSACLLGLWMHHRRASQPADLGSSSNGFTKPRHFAQSTFQYLTPIARFIFPLLLA